MGYVDKLLAHGERIVFETRRHWLAMVPTVLIDVVLVVAIFVLFGLLATAGPVAFLSLVLLVIPAVHFLVRWLIWRSEQYIVTTQRVIDVRGIFSKHVSDSSLEKVNDVVLDQSFLGRILDYGDIRVITGSDIGADTFRRMAHPLEFKTQMLNQKGEVTLSGEDVPAVLARLDELRKAGTISEEEFEREKQELLDRL
jgi:uncharacterized membrane protein YdbT with pleckstrin-like domain